MTRAYRLARTAAVGELVIALTRRALAALKKLAVIDPPDEPPALDPPTVVEVRKPKTP